MGGFQGASLNKKAALNERRCHDDDNDASRGRGQVMHVCVCVRRIIAGVGGVHLCVIKPSFLAGGGSPSQTALFWAHEVSPFVPGHSRNVH